MLEFKLGCYKLASLDQTKHLTSSRKSRAYFGGWNRKDFKKG